MPAGRPSKYKDIDLKKVRYLAEKGFTHQDFADYFGVNKDTITEWVNKHEEFSVSLKEGKAICDSRVERSLFERACGYSHPDTHITNYKGDIIATPITKHYPPDPTSMIFWLKNRKPTEWRDKQTVAIEDSRPKLNKYSDSQLEGAINFLEGLEEVSSVRGTSKKKA